MLQAGNHINLENRSPSHRWSPLPPVSALDSQGGCGESQDNDAQTLHSPQDMDTGHRTKCTNTALFSRMSRVGGHKGKVKWRVLSPGSLKSHESEKLHK